jgi:hypothetical protein
VRNAGWHTDSGDDAFIQLTLLPPPPFPDDDNAPTCDVTRNGLDIEAIGLDWTASNVRHEARQGAS